MKRNKRNVLHPVSRVKRVEVYFFFSPLVVGSKVKLEICLKNKDGFLRLYSK